MSETVKIRAIVKGDEGEVRVRVTHPMESGQRRGPQGNVLPAHHIQMLILSLNGKPVIESALGPAVSKNPLFAFRLRKVKVGDRLAVSWVDNKGDKGSGEALFVAS